jgi:hypothetical protein
MKPTPASPPTTEGSLTEAAERFIRNLSNRQDDNKLVFHNYALTHQLVRRTAELAQRSDASEDQMEVVQVAAWLMFSGYYFDAHAPDEATFRQAKLFLETEKYPPERTGRVLLCLKSAWRKQSPDSTEQRICTDAATSTIFGENFKASNPLQRLELELLQGQHFSDTDWCQFQLQQLLNARFYTPFGKTAFEPLVAQNILEQKRQVEKERRRAALQQEIRHPSQRFGSLGPRATQRTIQTFFRTNYRNHINLSAIADNKANIMISVNAIVISVIISILSYRNLSEANPVLFMPAVIFLLTGLTSLIFAVLASRPKITSLNDSGATREQAARNIVFFGNFVQLDLDDYEEALDEVFRKNELLVGNMARDLYHLGKVLDKKYRFLTISYNIFMIGFVTTVLMFLIALIP